MKLINTADYQPDVHYVNYVPVACDQAWGPRANLDFELVLIVAGRFSYADEKSEKMTCVPGDVLCIPPGFRHVLKNIQAPEKRASIISCIHLELFSGSFLHDDYELEAMPQRLTRTAKDPVVHELFKRCETIYTGFSPNRIALLQAVAWEILLHLEEFQSGGAERLSPRMRDMLDFIQRNVEKSVSRADLAREFSISPEHVNALFKKELKSTPTKQIHRAKTFRAYTCLTHDALSVKETADKLGFYDEFHFSKIFKRIIGLPPSRVRPRSAS